MIPVTYLPLFVTLLLRGMPGLWKNRPRLVLGGRVCMQALLPGRKTWAELARWTPAAMTAWHCRRLLQARYWHGHLLGAWAVPEALSTLPPPQDGGLYLVGDGSHNLKRGTQNPLGQKGRKSEHQPGFFGMRFALWIATWDSSRLPGALRLSRPKRHPAYQPDKALFRTMVGDCVPPAWAKRISVAGEAAYGSQEQMQMGLHRDIHDPARRWGCVFASARTWQTTEGKAIKSLVTHVPRTS